jgi:iron complex transport system substrate-binding protein
VSKPKILAYLTGFVLGCLILLAIPREKKQPRVHPWHEQTAPLGYYPLEVTDDYGREIVLKKQPRWVISLAPSITEILFALEMGDHLLAVTDWCAFPEEARKLRDAGASVGRMDAPDRERMATYAADLVLGTNLTPPEVYQALESDGRRPALALAHDDYADVREDIKAIGRILGVPGKALRLLQKLDGHKARIEAQIEPFLQQPKPRVLLLLSIEDGQQPGWTPGRSTWIHDLIEASHAINAAADVGNAWGQVSFENLLKMDPEILLIREAESASASSALDGIIHSLGSHPVWSQVSAVRNGRVHRIPNGPLSIPGPRAMQAYESIARAIWLPESTPAKP